MPNTSTALTSYTPNLTVSVCNKMLTLQRAASLEELWEAMTSTNSSMSNEDFDDERLPYWTELWPSSIALCELLSLKKHLIANKLCLDVGCGLGLTAMIGHMFGAKVLAFDYEKDALPFAKKNALCNAHIINEDNPQKNSKPSFIAMDWRKPAIKKNSIDFLWGGDIMYERQFAYTLLNFIDYALNEHGHAFIAEPCRTVYEHFRAELVRRKWNAQIVHTASIDAIYAQAVPVTVKVWEIWR